MPGSSEIKISSTRLLSMKCFPCISRRRAAVMVGFVVLAWLAYGGAWADVATNLPLSGPNLRFTRLGLSDGLSHADVRSITRDSQGFMWFGTWLDGANRYDGRTFKFYRHEPKDDHSLGFDNVNVVYEDKQHTLWVGTFGGGLDRYDRERDRFTHYRHHANDTNSLPDDTIRQIYEDDAGNLWIAGNAGICRFDRAAGTFFTYHSEPGVAYGRSLCRDRKTGLLWFGSRTGVYVLDPVTGKSIHYHNQPDAPASLSDDAITQIYQDRPGNIWIGTDHGLNRWDPATKSFVRYHFDPNNVNSIGDDFVTALLEDRAGRFWVGTANGLDLFDRSRQTFSHYRNNPDDPGSLCGNYINIGAIYEDDTGAIWIGTQGAGVSRLDSTASKFITYQNNPQDPNSLDQNTVTALYGDHTGKLWVGTADGLNSFDGQRFVRYFNDPKNTNSLSRGPVWAITESADHQLWIGVNGGGVCRFDGTNFIHFVHDPNNPDSLAGDYMYGLAVDHQGGLWVSVHSNGLDYFDGRRFHHFQPKANDPDSLPDRYVGTLYVDDNDCVWMGSATMGLIQFDRSTGKATAYLLDPETPHSKVGNWVRDINSDGRTIWVAAYSGLFSFDLATKKFTHCYTERDGMASSSVLAVQPDLRSNLWVTTRAGLSKLDLKTGVFRNYDVADGLQSAQFCERSRGRLPDGRIGFGGVNGFNLFSPDNMPENATPPPVVLTDFQLFNRTVPVGEDSPLKKAINVADEISLRYDQDVFRLRFAALNYSASQKNRYAYKLEGFDQDWRYTDANERSATYTKLPPGQYVFRVKASNNDGVWNERGVALPITIIPPWWLTWWFRTGLIVALCAMVLGGHYWRTYRMRKHTGQLELLVARRTAEWEKANKELQVANKELESFSYSVSHDLRAPLRAVDGFSRILLEDYAKILDNEGKELLGRVRAGSQRMSDLIDGLLQLSRLSRSAMRFEPVDLSALAATVIDELKSGAPQRQVECVIAPNLVANADAPLMRAVLENLLGNAWKFTAKQPAARIEFGAVMEQGMQTFFVRDNGAGFDMAYASKLFGVFQRLHHQSDFPGTGIGLSTVQRIIHRHGGQIRAESAIGKGATFYFTIPGQ